MVLGTFLQLTLTLGVEKPVGAVEIGFQDKDCGGTVQIAVVRRGGVNEFLRGGDAVFFQHHDEHLGVDERAGVEKFHAGNLVTD